MEMTRRDCLRGLGAAGVALAASAHVASAATDTEETTTMGEAKRRPNIVFIMADQLGARALGCYGSGVDSTPNLDRLAGDGVKFDRFYASVPVCAPNRATILTGRSAEIHGVVSNNYALQSDNPTYAHVLREHGYRTGAFGKMHQTPMSWPPPTSLGFLGFDEVVISEDPKWGPWIDWVREHHPEHYAAALAMTNGHGGRQGFHAPTDQAQGATQEQTDIKGEAYPRVMQPRIAASEWSRMYASPIPPEVHDTTFLTECGLDFIDRMGGGDAPFFCHISYVDPHDPYDPPEPYASMFDPDDMPDALPAEWEEQGPRLLRGSQTGYLRFEDIADDPAAIRKLRALYHGSLKFIDDQVGRVIDRLKQSGLWENTIVIFSTDHGEMLGDHKCIAKGLPHYDLGIRCPLIVAGGPVASGDGARLSCSLDLYPTFCEWAGIPGDDLPPLEGKSFAGFCGPWEGKEAWREIAVSISTIDTIITDDGWRLTQYAPGEGQLFNLREDPDEQRNLHKDPAHLEKKAELLERLIRLRANARVTPQYRNLGVDGAVKRDTGRRGEPCPRYDAPPSPWTVDGPRPQWSGDRA